MLYTHADLHVPPGGDAGIALGPWAPAAAEPSLDRAAFRRSLDRVLAWPFERVVVAHGSVKERGGRAELEEGYSWL